MINNHLSYPRPQPLRMYWSFSHCCLFVAFLNFVVSEGLVTSAAFVVSVAFVASVVSVAVVFSVSVAFVTLVCLYSLCGPCVRGLCGLVGIW